MREKIKYLWSYINAVFIFKCRVRRKNVNFQVVFIFECIFQTVTIHEMNTTYDAEMMIWITDLKGVRLPFRAAALVYKFMVRVVCETDLQWTLVCPSSYEGSSMKISSDRKVATTKLDDCFATWVVSGPLNDTLPSYFQIKIHQIGGKYLLQIKYEY